MTPKVIIGTVGAFIVGLILVLVITVGWGIGVANNETRLANAIKAKQVDNQSEFDNMWKSISQSAQITEAQAKQVSDVIVGYASARGKSGGSLVNAIHEAVPNVDTSTFNNLMNIVNGKRDAFAFRQKELLDLNREHDNIIDVMPGSIICGMLGRHKIEIKIVTSTKTEKVFETGKDDDTKLFGK